MLSQRFLMIATALLVAGSVAGTMTLQMRPVTVSVTQPQENTPAPVYGLGTVEARVTSDIGFVTTGTLVELRADQGDLIVAGAVMARLDDSAQQARVARAQAERRQAEAALAQAEARLLRAEAVQDQKQSSNARRQKLVRNGTVSAEAAEEAAAEAAVAAADVTVGHSDVDAARAAVESAAAQLAQERQALADLTLVAPYAALVVERTRELGSIIAASTPVFTVVAPDGIWVKAFVDEAQAGVLRVGQSAQITLRSRPGEPLSGRIARIDVANDRISEERIVNIAFAEIPQPFHLGEQAEVLVSAEPGSTFPTVSPAAVDSVSGDRAVIWVVEDGSLHRKDVRLGRRFADGRIEVIAGLAADASVVTAADAGLREGRRVAIDGGSAR